MEKAPPGLQNIVKRLAQRLRETNDLVSMAKRQKTEITAEDSKDSNTLTYDQMATAKESAVDLNLIPKKFKKDQVLIRQDADAMSVFLLKLGAVKVTRKEGDRIYELDELTINETFGEMSMFDENGKRFANVVAIDDGEAVVFSRKDMELMLRKAPLELLLIMESLCQKLKRSVGKHIAAAQNIEKLKAENRKLNDRISELESQLAAQAEKSSSANPKTNLPARKPNRMPLPTVKVNKLAPGDTIGLVTPASPLLDFRDIHRAKKVLQSIGLSVKEGLNIRKRTGFLAGSDQERAEDINRMFADPAIDAIMGLRGGWGSARILNLLDWDTIASNPKPLIGHSDLTALLNAVNQKTGIVTFLGPMAGYDMGRMSTPFKQRWFDKILMKPSAPLDIPRGRSGGKWVNLSSSPPVEGKIIGGNLSIVNSLMGTPYEIECEGCILVLEDVDEEPYKIDRMLCQLANAGKLDQAAGIVMGKCVNCESSGRMKYTFRFMDVLENWFKRAGKPVIYGPPVGHEVDKVTLPLGIMARLDSENLKFTLLETATKPVRAV